MQRSQTYLNVRLLFMQAYGMNSDQPVVTCLDSNIELKSSKFSKDDRNWCNKKSLKRGENQMDIILGSLIFLSITAQRKAYQVASVALHYLKLQLVRNFLSVTTSRGNFTNRLFFSNLRQLIEANKSERLMFCSIVLCQG